MDPIEQENALLEQRIAEIEASLSGQKPESYGLKQLAFDVPVGITRAAAGTADIVAYPFVKGLQYAGAPVETFGTTKLLNALIESDKGLAGPGTAEILGVKPKTEVQEAVEFMTPTPGSKGKLAKEAGLGLAAYLGSEAAQFAAPDSPYAGLVGALVAPAGVQGITSATKGAVRAATPTLDILRGDENALKALAQKEVLQSLGEEGVRRVYNAQEYPALLTGAGGLPLTAAEIAQTPSAAKFQQAIRQTQEGGNILEDALQKRKDEIGAALERIGPTAQQGELSAALRGTAQEAAISKQTQDFAILEKLGLTPEVLSQTKTERGATLLDSLAEQKNQAKPIVDKAWSSVPKKAKVDAAYALTQAQRDFRSFDPLEVKTLSGTGKTVIGEVNRLLDVNDGRINVQKLQALRSTAGAALKEASGKNPREVKLMKQLREDLDLIGVEQIATKKADAPKTAIEKLKEAIAARREFGEKFERGVTGELLKVRKLQSTVKASQALDRALKYPENVDDILGKFGKDSEQVVILRAEALSRLEKQKNPTEYLGRNKDIYQKLFQDDYKNITTYAQRKGQKASLDEYSNISEAAIPNKVFADEASAEKFVKQFQGTPIIDYARGKFIQERLTKRGDSLVNLEKNNRIATQLFGDQLSQLQSVLKDLEIAKSPEALQRLAVGKNSITSVAQTALGAIKNGRVAIDMLKTGKVTAPIAGAIAGIPGVVAGGGVEAITGSVLGYKLGQWAETIATTRQNQLDRFSAELLANPKLIKLAAAPPTEKNIGELVQLGQRLGYFGGRAITQQVANENTSASAPLSLEEENTLLEERIRTIEASLK